MSGIDTDADPSGGAWLLRDCVSRQAQFRARHIACHELSSGRRLDYQTLDAAIARTAGFLAGRLSTPGARVAILARNSLHHVQLFYACARIGAVFQPLNWRLSWAELSALLDDGRPELLIVQDEFAEAAAAARAHSPALPVILFGRDDDPLHDAIEASDPIVASAVDPDAPQLLLYTSGTTGRPKGVIATPRTTFYGAYNNREVAALTERSVMLCDSPMFHVIGLIANMHAVFQAGGQLILADRFSPEVTLRLMGAAETPVTHYFCVPQMARALRDDPSYASTDTSRLVALFTGGAPMPQELVEAFGADGVLALNNFGLTESTGGVFGPPIDRAAIDQKPGSCGVLTPAIEVRLAGIDGREAAVGEIGEVWIRGPSVTPGYWNQPEATAAAFAEGGWFRTGDAGRRDADGFYWLVDRWKDMYITGGENVYPAEVEAVLRQAPGVADVAVVGIPDPRWGESGVAFVVRQAEAVCDEASLIGFCAERLARYKRPSQLRFVEALPRTASGKLQKQLLRASLTPGA